MSIERKFKMALDETRLLMLGTQILFGFEFNAVFQEGFKELPQSTRMLDAVALLLIALSMTLLIAPSAQHRLAEYGQITRRVRHAVTTFAGWALLPFACALGLALYIVLAKPFGAGIAAAAGAFFTALALVFWFGLAFAYRSFILRRSTHMSEKDLDKPTPLDARIEQMLTESRIIIPGAQALMGFQLIAVLSKTFVELPAASQIVHALSLGANAVALVLLIAPAAFHRIAFHGAETERFFRLGSGLVTTALLPLALGISGDIYVAVARIANESAVGAAAAAGSLLLFLIFWYVQPLRLRARR
jgi:small-conductance mechanosensitive channel